MQNRFRPRLEALDERIVPDGSGGSSQPPYGPPNTGPIIPGARELAELASALSGFDRTLMDFNAGVESIRNTSRCITETLPILEAKRAFYQHLLDNNAGAEALNAARMDYDRWNQCVEGMRTAYRNMKERLQWRIDEMNTIHTDITFAALKYKDATGIPPPINYEREVPSIPNDISGGPP